MHEIHYEAHFENRGIISVTVTCCLATNLFSSGCVWFVSLCVFLYVSQLGHRNRIQGNKMFVRFEPRPGNMFAVCFMLLSLRPFHLPTVPAQQLNSFKSPGGWQHAMLPLNHDSTLFYAINRDVEVPRACSVRVCSFVGGAFLFPRSSLLAVSLTSFKFATRFMLYIMNWKAGLVRIGVLFGAWRSSRGSSCLISEFITVFTFNPGRLGGYYFCLIFWR